MAEICPKCGSSHTARIIYGRPDIDGINAAECKEVILGGCVVDIDSPDYGCFDCKYEWIHISYNPELDELMSFRRRLFDRLKEKNN